MGSALSEGRVLSLLEARHPPGAWAFFRHVRSGTGWFKFDENERYADAVALGLWPSRGLELHGFEVKVSRSDWLRELRQPDKATAVSRYCDRWWVVAPDGVVQFAELPPSWGLMVVRESNTELRVAKPAPACETKPLDRAFVASLVRNLRRLVNEPEVALG